MERATPPPPNNPVERTAGSCSLAAAVLEWLVDGQWQEALPFVPAAQVAFAAQLLR